MPAAIDHPLLIATADAYWSGDRKQKARMEEGFRVTALLKRGTPMQKLRAYAEGSLQALPDAKVMSLGHDPVWDRCAGSLRIARKEALATERVPFVNRPSRVR